MTREESIKWLTDKEYEYLSNLSPKGFYEWVRIDMNERFEHYDEKAMIEVVAIMKGQYNDD